MLGKIFLLLVWKTLLFYCNIIIYLFLLLLLLLSLYKILNPFLSLSLFFKINSINCIRGHRVKKCQHFDRELVPVQKRGRQVSQCNHCRILRTTSGSHVKCTCAIATGKNI